MGKIDRVKLFITQDKMSYQYVDQFGFLPITDTITISCGEIAPIPEFETIVTAIAKITHPDGNVYPPVSYRATQKSNGSKLRKISKTKRPGHFQRLPPTHTLKLDQAFLDEKAARYGLAGFIIHFLGFLYGYRSQFYNWWMDKRIKVVSDCDHTSPHPKQASFYLEKAIQAWSSWLPRQQCVAINILYLHTRTSVYESDWERFQAEYQVIDAIFSLAKTTKKLNKKRVPHAEQIISLCHLYEIPNDLTKIAEIVKLRNDLLHEALWDGGIPGEAGSEASFRASYWLHNLSKRIMLAALGMDNDYIRSPWWFMGRLDFGSNRQDWM